MTAYRLAPAADHRLDEIYLYTRERWEEVQAEAYVLGLFDAFEAIAARRLAWRAIPAEFEVSGYFCRYEHHFIYWRELEDGAIGIVAILHERMHQLDRLKDDLEG